ncbi:ATP-binding protein [Tumebacillus sp. ITR2]|uniref:ATP-binding protein n=1 Tax=Tumebacillus amylolyticus TaxID=2801339 RepID=A0ABS1J7S8_9BACL|nr:ATP-binding protein [Tumebacillus amylolyticus]MBL0386319.1 ATP-binding protein [Tumebacillus amylolyticus]
MQIVGQTTQLEAWVASRTRKFHINEILIIEDPDHRNPKAEVIETRTFNRYIPLASEQSNLVDTSVLEGLRSVGFDIEDEEIHLAKLRLIEELPTPIRVGAQARVPSFAEVEDLLIKRKPHEGLTLGVIQGSREIAKDMPESLQHVALLFDKENGVGEQGGVPFVFDYKSMDQYPHIGIFGGSGSGKSFGLRVLLEELMLKQVPAVVFDPHFELTFDQEFPDLPEDFRQTFKKRFVTLDAGEDIGVEFSELIADDIVSLLRASSGSITDAMETAIKVLHKKADSFLTYSTRMANLAEALDNEKEIREQSRDEYLNPADRERVTLLHDLLVKYKDKVGGFSGTLRSVLRRLTRLEMEGVFTSAGTKKVEEAFAKRQLVVIRGSMYFLNVFAFYVVRKLYRKRRDYRDSIQKGRPVEEKFPPFVIITDEAHNFAPKGDIPAPAKGVLKEIAQEGRKYGVFLVFATQRPALLDDTITAQLSTKMVFRTVRSVDIAVIKEETDITAEEAARLPYLSSGTAFISSAITGRTTAVRIRVSKTTSPHFKNPFEELEEGFAEQDAKVWEAVLPSLPIDASNLNAYLTEIGRKVGRLLSFDELEKTLEDFVDQGKLMKVSTPFGARYSKA